MLQSCVELYDSTTGEVSHSQSRTAADVVSCSRHDIILLQTGYTSVADRMCFRSRQNVLPKQAGYDSAADRMYFCSGRMVLMRVV